MHYYLQIAIYSAKCKSGDSVLTDSIKLLLAAIASLCGGWVPGLFRGFHFWQPVPRLNNALVVSTKLQPSYEPPHEGTGTHHTDQTVGKN